MQDNQGHSESVHPCGQRGRAESVAQDHAALGAFAQRRTTGLWKADRAQEADEVKIGSLEWTKLSAKRKWEVARRIAVRVRLHSLPKHGEV
jgi:hypothetical protein